MTKSRDFIQNRISSVANYLNCYVSSSQQQEASDYKKYLFRHFIE